MAEKQVEFTLKNPDDAALLFGAEDKLLKFVEEALKVSVNYRGETVQIKGEFAEQARQVFEALLVLISRALPVHTPDVAIAIKMVQTGDMSHFMSLYEVELTKDADGKPIRVKNLGQKTYVD
ncbi:MAG: PhoH family protein, partial [Streptococcaceae bacterium]|nr:PhoH family protein [Streptococcaceae bacterium]